jgi:hypothetical protein
MNTALVDSYQIEFDLGGEGVQSLSIYKIILFKKLEYGVRDVSFDRSKTSLSQNSGTMEK